MPWREWKNPRSLLVPHFMRLFLSSVQFFKPHDFVVFLFLQLHWFERFFTSRGQSEILNSSLVVSFLILLFYYGSVGNITSCPRGSRCWMCCQRASAFTWCFHYGCSLNASSTFCWRLHLADTVVKVLTRQTQYYPFCSSNHNLKVDQFAGKTIVCTDGETFTQSISSVPVWPLLNRCYHLHLSSRPNFVLIFPLPIFLFHSTPCKLSKIN